MPTYKNETDRKITYPTMSYMSWSPGETKALRFHVPYERLGLTLISFEPLVSDNAAVQLDQFIVLDSVVAGETPNSVTVEMPTMASFEVSIYCYQGAAKMYIGDATEKFVLLLEGDNHFSTYNYGSCPHIRFVADSEEWKTQCRIKVEQRNMFNAVRRFSQ